MDTSKTKSLGQNKRFWTEEGDNKLIESLLELNNDRRFKAEGSFKPRHLKELGKKLHEKQPGFDLLAKPHIEEEDSNCRKTRMVCIYSESYEAAPFKLNSFPYYDDLSMFFGKDRATGQHAETPADVEEQIQNEGRDNSLDDNASSENVDNANLNEKHMQLGNELSRTTTLAIMERHKVFRLIVQDNDLVSYFFSLHDELKDD
ncbi:hypothetical protein Ddye_015948 [Dipteronia dyeriana]|uniref:Uncharacterized protein n=1 Tax=Dipteronia dyeriana TaxID=168575 RepID=A0AAD9U6D9_9ROSI|nr:hypothetical protein Ddye_015948 [Dipteronia dyeriana]